MTTLRRLDVWAMVQATRPMLVNTTFLSRLVLAFQFYARVRTQQENILYIVWRYTEEPVLIFFKGHFEFNSCEEDANSCQWHSLYEKKFQKKWGKVSATFSQLNLVFPVEEMGGSTLVASFSTLPNYNLLWVVWSVLCSRTGESWLERCWGAIDLWTYVHT